MRVLRTTTLGLLVLATAACGDSQEALRVKLGDVEPVGDWIYDDIDAGIERARETGRPLLFTFRCIP